MSAATVGVGERLSYLAQRVGRNLLPAGVAAWARRRFGGIPGGESDAPGHFAGHYVETLAREGRSFEGAEVLIFGHGPSYGFACALLAAGARRIVLFDPYAEPDDRLNRLWLERYPDYLERVGDAIRPRSAWMSEVVAEGRPGDVRFPKVDMVVSTSVYEHLDDPEYWTGKLARATAIGGCHLHMIDLRDHFFHLPFEMLCYSERVWRRWLNPRQHLNRWRLRQHEEVFQRHFGRVELEVLERDPEAFAATRSRIRPRFLTGDPEIDCATEIEIFAAEPG